MTIYMYGIIIIWYEAWHPRYSLLCPHKCYYVYCHDNIILVNKWTIYSCVRFWTEVHLTKLKRLTRRQRKVSSSSNINKWAWSADICFNEEHIKNILVTTHGWQFYMVTGILRAEILRTYYGMEGWKRHGMNVATKNYPPSGKKFICFYLHDMKQYLGRLCLVTMIPQMSNATDYHHFSKWVEDVNAETNKDRTSWF